MIDYVKPRKDYKSKDIRDYVYKINGKYQIVRNREYYGRYDTKDDAKKVSNELKRIGWNKSNLKKAQSNVGVKSLNRYYRNTSGYARVSKQKDNRVKQGYMWTYSYVTDTGDNRKIYDKTIKGLEKKVKGKGLMWEKL